jgi:hypothetical protein
MDPEACLRLCDEAIRAGERATARGHLAAYWLWRCTDGFEPILASRQRGDEFAEQCERRLRETAGAQLTKAADASAHGWFASN